MEKIQISGTASAADADGLATATECTGAGPWAPDTSTSVGDGLAHKITITQVSATNHSAKTAIITGTDAAGRAQTETGLALPNGAVTVTSTKYFLTVTSVAISATVGADTFTMGWAVDAVSAWRRTASHTSFRNGFNVGLGCTVTSGSPTYTVQLTFDESAVFDHATLVDKTENGAGQQAFPVAALRLEWTAAGGVSLTGLQY